MGVDLTITFYSSDNLSEVLGEFDCPESRRTSSQEREELLNRYQEYLAMNLSFVEQYPEPLYEGELCFPLGRLIDASSVLEDMGFNVYERGHTHRYWSKIQRDHASLVSALSPIMFSTTIPIWNPHLIHDISILSPSTCATLSAQLSDVHYPFLEEFFPAHSPRDGRELLGKITSMEKLEDLCRWFNRALSIAASSHCCLIASVS